MEERPCAGYKGGGRRSTVRGMAATDGRRLLRRLQSLRWPFQTRGQAATWAEHCESSASRLPPPSCGSRSRLAHLVPRLPVANELLESGIQCRSTKGKRQTAVTGRSIHRE